MERAGCKTAASGLQKLEGDDVEKSIEVLDKVLSEFEDPDSLPHIPVHIEPESPSQGNQSEDDGYMSMNGRRAKIPPDFHQPLSNESPASPPHLLVDHKNFEQSTDDINKITNNNNNNSNSNNNNNNNNNNNQDITDHLKQSSPTSTSTLKTVTETIVTTVTTAAATTITPTTTTTTTTTTPTSSNTSPLKTIQKSQSQSPSQKQQSNNTTTLELSIQEPIKVTIKSSPVSTSHQTNINDNNIITEKKEEIIVKSNQTPPPPAEVAEAIISNLLPRSPSITQKQIIESPINETAALQLIANTDRINNAKNLQNRLIQLDSKHITSTSCNKNGVMVIQNVSIGTTIPNENNSMNLSNNVDNVVSGNQSHKWNNTKDDNIPNDIKSIITEQQKQQLISQGTTPGLVVGGVGINVNSGNQTNQSPAQQTTLPKARPSNVNPSKYSSLPCSGPTRLGRSLGNNTGSGTGSFDSGTGDRNILGIGISAVHDAVLRGGVAKLPEPIINEHPVTIYPGRASPVGKRVPPRTLPGSIERHREVCRNNLNNELHSPTQQTIYDPTEGNPPSYVLLTSASTTNMSPLQRLAITKSPSSPLVAVQQHIILQNSVSSNQLIDNKNLLNSLQIPPCKPKRHINSKTITTATSNLMQSNGSRQDQNNIDDLIISAAIDNNCNRKKMNGGIITTTDSSSEEEFSDDSLEEGQSLPPPPAPPLVPPPPSLSAPVTPSKRGSIAWEINLDDHLPPPPPPSQINEKQIKLEKRLGKSNNNHHHHHHNNKNNIHNLNHDGIGNNNKTKSNSNLNTTMNGSNKEKKIELSASAKIIERRRTRSQSGDNLMRSNHNTDNDSISSFASTPGNSGGSMSQNASPQHRNHHMINHVHLTSKNRSSSLEWPDPPEAPICSTEDEAASIYSDSDDIIPTYPINMTGKGTYVIRKGRKERSRLSEIHTSMSSSINSRLSNEGSLLSGMTASQSLLVPNSRHSIDLGSSTHSPISVGTGNNILPNRSAMLSPRSRLSLDLTSPIIANPEHPVSLNQILQSPVTNGSNAGTPNSRFNDYKAYTNSYDQIQHHIETNGNGGSNNVLPINGNTVANITPCTLNNNNNNIINSATTNVNGSLTHDISNTPRRELAPPIEEDEEQDSESQASRGAPLRQIENNISALLRGDIAIARIGDISHPRRPLGFRPGVHKSESAKEMLLSQLNNFGPLPPSPPSSSPEPEIDSFPPLPPSPQENNADDEEELDDTNAMRGMHALRISSRTRLKPETHAPAIPPHRSGNIGAPPSINTLKTRSMDANYTKKYATNTTHINVPGTLPCEIPTTNSSRRRLQSGAYPKRSAQSPREERRLQTSCSLPETPIFARGCDIPRTPHRRAPEVPPHGTVGGTNNCGSRTAPRSNTNTTSSLGSSIVGIGNSTLGNNNGRHQPQPPQPQRSITQALTGAEMLRLAGGPARGWYPKQRSMRPASTEHLDRLHRTQGSMRAWDTAIGVGHHTGGGMSVRGGVVGGNECVGRKPLTLPPNLTPKFFNKSPREALRRVTSLLIKKGNGKDKESKHHRDKDVFTTSSIHRSPGSAGDIPIPNHMYINNGSTTSSSTTTTSNNHPLQQQNQSQANENNSKNSGHNQTTHKKKGFFKSFWKKSKHYSLDQQ